MYKGNDLVINLCSDDEEEEIGEINLTVPEEKEVSSYVQSEYSRSKSNRKKPKYINITDLSSRYNIIKIEDAKYNPTQKITKFILLVEDVNTGEEYKMKATNNHMKIYAPVMLCDYYERRMALDKF